MTLLIAVFAAIISTLVWYLRPASNMRIGTLALMYWGASLMWLVDAIHDFIEIGADYFTPTVEEMFHDGYLGLSVVALGLVIWLAIVLVKDPDGRLRAALKNK